MHLLLTFDWERSTEKHCHTQADDFSYTHGLFLQAQAISGKHFSRSPQTPRAGISASWCKHNGKMGANHRGFVCY